MSALGFCERDLQWQRGRGAELQARGDVGRQILRLDDLGPRQDGRALNRVLQLAYVPWPGIAEESFEGGR